MKSIPIIGKFGAILAVFGIFSIAGAIYSTSQMRFLITSTGASLETTASNAIATTFDLILGGLALVMLGGALSR
jgi:hypothetical protein